MLTQVTLLVTCLFAKKLVNNIIIWVRCAGLEALMIQGVLMLSDTMTGCSKLKKTVMCVVMATM